MNPNDIFVFKEENLPAYSNSFITSVTTRGNVLGKVYIMNKSIENVGVGCEKCSILEGICPHSNFDNKKCICGFPNNHSYFTEITHLL